MKRNFTIILLFNINLCFPQGVNNLWLLGFQSWAGIPYGGTNLDFGSGSLNVYYHYRTIDFDATNANITDNSGNLLFYSNGVCIGNSLDDTMQNGNGLNPGWYVNNWSNGLLIVQGNLILRQPDDSNVYYLLHETLDENTNPAFGFSPDLFYTKIDMAAANGLGAVTSKNNSIIHDTLITGLITACKHANGRDWWIVVHRGNSNIYYSILLSPSGLAGPFPQSIGTYLDMVQNLNPFQSVFSPDGTKYAIYLSGGYLEVLNFDRCTGLFSNPQQLNISYHSFLGGLAFSPNSRLLYVPSNDTLYQYDTNAPIIASSQTTIASWDSFYSPSPPFATTFFLAQLAPDSKIYITPGNSTLHMHCINSPDSAGNACNFQQHSILLTTYNAFTIPNHPNYFLGPVIGSVCDSLGMGISENTMHDFNFNIYPNPVLENQLTCTYLLPQNKSGSIVIYNSTGEKVFVYQLPQWSTFQKIKLPELCNGIYLARIQSGFYFASKKFIIQK